MDMIIHEIQELETLIEIALLDYQCQMDTKYLFIASHLTFELEELKRCYG